MLGLGPGLDCFVYAIVVSPLPMGLHTIKQPDLSSMMSFPVTCSSSLVAYDQSDSSMREEGEAARALADSTTSTGGRSQGSGHMENKRS